MSAPVLYDHILSCNNSTIAIHVIKLSIKSFSNRPFQLFYVVLNEPLTETRSIYIKTFTICHSTTETIKLRENNTKPILLQYNNNKFNTLLLLLLQFVVWKSVWEEGKKVNGKSLSICQSPLSEKRQDRMYVKFTHFSGLERKTLTNLFSNNKSLISFYQLGIFNSTVFIIISRLKYLNRYCSYRSHLRSLVFPSYLRAFFLLQKEKVVLN